MIRKVFSRKRSLLFLILTLIVTIGCHADPFNTQSETISLKENCRLIEHAMGETCIPQNPQRIVTISDFTLHHTFVLDVNPIGNAFDDWRGKVPTYLIDKKDEIERIEQLGTGEQPDLEKILRLKPDLIISWGWIGEIYPLLSQVAPTVIDSLESSGNDGWREHFNFVAEVLNKQDIAQRAWNRYYQRIKILKNSLGKQYESQKISIMTVAHDFKNHASSKNSFIGSILNDVGLTLSDTQNIEGGSGWVQYSSEEFVSFFDGDILFVTITGDSDRARFEELKSKPLWSKLRAVEQGNVYVVDSLTWQGANLLAADAVIDDLYEYLVNTPSPDI